ncbi:hypothetical protein GCM10011391_35170 [Pullulanibacillus camelliae]|uniref:Hydroxyacid dehydrogenase n=1 Tax=Pullulanibacillus camelliae TaxID=1707096 RepID=A0A8J2YLJ0_9BACL|nr:hydroxyacid dehydrogenase [Pullulanibacillus camelliae]GGE53239.1 hypothetical protein GCM10011391_35170 [Pullulanibacillus camelliae]
MMKVLITELMWEEGIEALGNECAVDYDQELWRDRKRLLAKLKDVDGLIVRNQTQVDEELLRHAPHLKVIGRLGVGLDNINLAACRQRHLTVVYAKNANAISVAEYVMGAMLSVSRTFSEASRDVKQGNWNRKQFTGREIYGKTLGLIGVGEIAGRIAKRATAFGMQVIGYDPFIMAYDFPIAEVGIKLSTFEELLQASDYISIHVPLTEATKNLLTASEFAIMKPSCCLINTSRGGIVNESDLADALKAGQISKAILDVLQQEPASNHHPLIETNKAILTPHIAGLTEESQVRTSLLVATEVNKVLDGRRSLCAV